MRTLFVGVVLALLMAGPVFAQEGAAADAVNDAAGAVDAVAATATESAQAAPSEVSSQLWALWVLAPLGCIVGLIFAFIFYKQIMKYPEGTEKMIEIAAAVRTGAIAYIKRQYSLVAIVFVCLFIVFAFMSYGLNVLPAAAPFAFITGGFFSALSGYLGLRTATNAGARTANAARQSLNSGLTVAFRAGSVMGLVVVGFALMNVCIWFLGLYFFGGGKANLNDLATILITSGIGASTQALFARCGGGIFTKAADVGADLVGKVEAGIPEDDPRNPATIADNVGDNVGDIAGMGADLFESYMNSILACMPLGIAAVLALTLGGGTNLHEVQLRYILLPMIIAGAGIILSVIGMFLVRVKEGATQKDLLGALGRGVNTSTVLIIPISLLLCWLTIGTAPLQDAAGKTIVSFWGIWGAILAGLIAGVIVGKSTEYYTSADYKPTKNLADQALTGAGTVIIFGLSLGMLSTAIPVIVTTAAILASYSLAGGFTEPSAGLYGIAVSAVGMLSTLGIVLSTDTYGPIADNAGGNAEMSGLDPEVRRRTDALDSLGNTTAATGKGFAIASAALTALALIASFVEQVKFSIGVMAKNLPAGEVYDQMGLKIQAGVATVLTAGKDIPIEKTTLSNITTYYNVSLMNPSVLAGLLIGAMVVFVFCALTMRAVGRAAGKMVDEVRRQFREIKGILEGTAKPDYARCVDIAARAAQREMIVPSLLAIVVPVATGVLLGVAGVTGLLTAGLATGFAMAIMMANAGGSWDNAKKYIEGGQHGGKGSIAHKAAVVGDTVGDPFKDTSGPSVNILIKLMSMVAVVFAGVTVKYAPVIAGWLGMKAW